MAQRTPKTRDRTQRPNAAIKVMKAWFPRIGSFLINAGQRSRGGGKRKRGTLITSTRISQSTSSATKNIAGSAMSFQENFTALLRADVKGKHPSCQESE